MHVTNSCPDFHSNLHVLAATLKAIALKENVVLQKAFLGQAKSLNCLVKKTRKDMQQLEKAGG